MRTVCILAAGSLLIGTPHMVGAQSVVQAVPRGSVLPTSGDPVFRSARVASGTLPANTSRGIWFRTQSDEAEEDEIQQHAIAFDYTPAPIRVRGLLQYQLAEGVWSSTWADGFGRDGRLFLCYGMYVPSGTSQWRFRVFALEEEDLTYRFSAERTASVTCTREGENDGGTPGTGSGGDFGPFDIYVDGSQDQQAQIAIAIRDHACEDGDIVSVYIGDGYGDRAVFTNTELFNDWDERLVTVRAGVLLPSPRCCD